MVQTKTFSRFVMVALMAILWPGAADALTWNDAEGSCFETTLEVEMRAVSASFDETELPEAGC